MTSRRVKGDIPRMRIGRRQGSITLAIDRNSETSEARCFLSLLFYDSSRENSSARSRFDREANNFRMPDRVPKRVSRSLGKRFQNIAP